MRIFEVRTIMGKLFFFFIDGIGLGENDKTVNPMRRFLSPFLGSRSFCKDSVPTEGDSFLLLPIDASLGIDGLPQSATGQTSIMTGENAARSLGYHMTAFPNGQLIDLIKRRNLFHDLHEKKVAATCANLYSQTFLEQRRKRHKNMLPVSTLSMESAGIPLRFMEDYREGRALFADITNSFLREHGYDIPVITPAEGARRIRALFNEYEFVFFEYFLTDTYGHNRNYRSIVAEVDMLNTFIEELKGYVEDETDPIDLLITSDHGNAEDNRTGDHSLNPVPFFFASRTKSTLFARYRAELHDLTDIKPAILSYFDTN